MIYICHLGNGWSGHPSVVDVKQLEGVIMVTYNFQTSLTNSVTKGILEQRHIQHINVTNTVMSTKEYWKWLSVSGQYCQQ